MAREKKENRFYKNKTTLTVYLVLRALILVILVRDVLRREYQRSTEQIKLCIGGFGAYPYSRGSTCYCVDLYSGKESRFERQDILGTLERSQLPQWAEIGLKQYEHAHPHRGNEIGKEHDR